mmetsp:Transcript_77921/g.142521  ORF Transcript_77921/g.142521 Transcript_77921/m.142521 type:complete len:81 (-) Transcript_77921:297-539(-)
MTCFHMPHVCRGLSKRALPAAASNSSHLRNFLHDCIHAFMLAIQLVPVRRRLIIAARLLEQLTESVSVSISQSCMLEIRV